MFVDLDVCSGMGETEHTDLYRVLGATSGDSVQHIKHKYQQLALQVNTHVSACSPEPRRWEVQPKSVL